MKLDAIVVGARCAGAATALLLARAGARVMLVDRGRYGTDTLSTHALMRGAVLQLKRWGVLPEIVEAGTPPVESTTFYYSGSAITIPIEPRFGVSALYAPRRALIDRLLVDAAWSSGAHVRYGVQVQDLIFDERGDVRGIVATADGRQERLYADVVVGADGIYSTIARRVGAESVVEGQHSTGVLYSYWEGLQIDGFSWWFRPGGSIGAIPTNNGATCVFVAVPSARFRNEVRGDIAGVYRRMLREVAPEFGERLESATRVEPVRGFGGHVGFIRRSSGPGWALVGDAGYFKDPLTAHGMTDALRDAELLARALMGRQTDALTEYETTRNDLSRRLFEVTDSIASLAHGDEEMQSLHRAFSSEMSREVRAVEKWGRRSFSEDTPAHLHEGVLQK